MFKFRKSDITAVLDKIASVKNLYIPTDTNGNTAEYRKYESGMKLTEKVNTVRSAKDLFFPQTQNLADFKMNGKNIDVVGAEPDDSDFVIFGVRGCDVKSFEVLDKVFLSDPVDPYYKSRREHGTVVSFACGRPSETCFCGTFGVDFADPDGDMTLWEWKDDYYVEPKTEKGNVIAEIIGDLIEECSDDPVWECKTEMWNVKKRLPLASLTTDGFGDGKMNELFGSDKWNELSQSCLGCGTCTFVCPTCQCYDVRDFDTGHGIKRFRCWDSCMYSDFTLMSAGQPRPSQKERFRQRFMHKLVYMPMNFDGTFGCVGCGRCLASCPQSLNIVKVMKAMKEDKK